MASWIKAKSAQVDLFSGDVSSDTTTPTDKAPTATPPPVLHGAPLLLPIKLLHEDPNNPRTEFPEAEIDELADDIRQHGVLQPIVVHPANAQGHYLIHFGAKRWRAAQRAGLSEVPFVVRDAPADPYTQVAENQKRHGLSPLDLARFIKDRVDAGASNAVIAKRLGMNLTTVAHHLTLLSLPPELDAALKSGRCTSPRTLHELRALHDHDPSRVQALLAGSADITRKTMSALRVAADDGNAPLATPLAANKLITQANAACDRLEHALSRIEPSNADKVALPDLIALRIRVEGIAQRWLKGSDGQTPAQI